MVEFRQIAPVFGYVAGFAAKRFAGCIERGHAYCELPVMHVFMTGLAGHGREVELCGCTSSRRFMAFITRHCLVSPSKFEVQLLVHSESEIRQLECSAGVALFAAIAPGSACKLAFVHVFVAIGAKRVFDLEPRILASRSMAGFAFDAGVREGEWKTSLGVIGD